MSTPAPRYSVVVPVRDEAETIGPFLRALRAALPSPFEVLVCYDDEEESTLPALAALPAEEIPEAVRLVRNSGRPGPKEAIEAGMRAALAPVVVVMMADLSDDLPRVESLVAHVEAGAAIACASRYAPGGRQIGGPLLKGLMSRTAGLLLHLLSGLPTRDATNSFKAYSRAFLERTPIESRAGFSLALELTVKAHLAGERVVEAPATWHDRRGGASKFRLLRWLPGYLTWFFWGLQALLQSPPGARRDLRTESPPRAGWARALAAAALLALVALSWLELPHELAGDELDPSWRSALGHAFLEGRHLGSELVFTGGPWAFLASPTFDRTLLLPRLIWAALWALGATLLTCRLLVRLPSVTWRLALVALLLVAPPEPYLFALLAAVLLVVSHESTTWRSVLLTAAYAGFAATLKLSLLVFSAAMLVPLLALALRSRGWRAATSVALTTAGTYIVLWRLSGQPLAGLGRYLSISAELTAGYGQAMSLTSPHREWVFGLVAIALLLLAATRISFDAGHRVRELLLPGTLALCLFLAFRHGFTRQDADDHMAPFFSLVAALAAALPAFAVVGRPRRRGATALRVVTIVVAVGSLAHLSPSPIQRFATRARELVSNGRVTLLPWRERPNLESAEAELAAKWRLDHLRSRIGDGSVDLFTVQQGVLFLNGLRWTPRPVFQSYAAFTPRLAELNRAFLAGARAPEWLLVRWYRIDARLPSLEDGPALLELLARYRPVDEEKGFLLLHRAPNNRQSGDPPTLGKVLWQGRLRLGDALALNGMGGRPKALAMKLRPTLYGRLLGGILGAPELGAELRTEDGRRSILRIVPTMAESPFLIDPAAHGDRDLDRLLRGETLPHPVSLRLLPTPRVLAFYQPQVEATLYDLPALAARE